MVHTYIYTCWRGIIKKALTFIRCVWWWRSAANSFRLHRARKEGVIIIHTRRCGIIDEETVLCIATRVENWREMCSKCCKLDAVVVSYFIFILFILTRPAKVNFIFRAACRSVHIYRRGSSGISRVRSRARSLKGSRWLLKKNLFCLISAFRGDTYAWFCSWWI